MSDGSRRYRQYAGLALVVIAYVGGIIGWSCAVLRMDAQPSAGVDSTQATHRRAVPPAATSAPSTPAARLDIALTSHKLRRPTSAD